MSDQPRDLDDNDASEPAVSIVAKSVLVCKLLKADNEVSSFAKPRAAKDIFDWKRFRAGRGGPDKALCVTAIELPTYRKLFRKRGLPKEVGTDTAGIDFIRAALTNNIRKSTLSELCNERGEPKDTLDSKLDDVPALIRLCNNSGILVCAYPSTGSSMPSCVALRIESNALQQPGRLGVNELPELL